MELKKSIQITLALTPSDTFLYLSAPICQPGMVALAVPFQPQSSLGSAPQVRGQRGRGDFKDMLTCELAQRVPGSTLYPWARASSFDQEHEAMAHLAEAHMALTS